MVQENLQTKELHLTVNELEKLRNHFDQLKYNFEDAVTNYEILQEDIWKVKDESCDSQPSFMWSVKSLS